VIGMATRPESCGLNAPATCTEPLAGLGLPMVNEATGLGSVDPQDAQTTNISSVPAYRIGDQRTLGVSMDNLCHTLVGAAMAETGLKHRTRWGSVALMVAANLPDLDVLVFATDTPPVSFRRGWTHGVLAQVLLPWALAGVFTLLARRQTGFARNASSPPLRPLWLVALGYLGIYSHVFLDYLNNYGVRLLAPVDWRWFYGDAVFIVDPWLWLVLGLGVWLARRRGRTTPATTSLGIATAYIAVMLALASDARTFVAAQWTSSAGHPPRALMVGPVPVVPWTRDVIIDAGDEYRTGRFAVWPRRLELSAERIPKNDRLPGVDAARREPPVAGFLVWTRFPFWEADSQSDRVRLTVRDMRFRGRGPGFAATAVVPGAASREPSGSSPVSP
jgi:inner membrane protein